MAQTIFGREEELKTLKRLLCSTKAEFLAVYGRRRVGKTFLIDEYFKNRGHYLCVTGTFEGSKQQQLFKFYRDLQTRFPQMSQSIAPREWDEALYLLKELADKLDSAKKMILFFDELPWLASKRSGFLPALEYFWNHYGSRISNLILIVCGSAASWMIKKIVNNRGGLYGRLSEIIKLSPFSLAETEKFLLSQQIRLNRKQIVEIYMALGGIAKYLTYLRPGESSAQAINRLCFLPQGQLVTEFQNLYQSLFEDSTHHVQIIHELAKRPSGINQKDLLDGVKMSSGGQFSTILQELEESGFLTAAREFHKKSKEKRFWLIDEYSHFYISWMEKIKATISLGSDQNYWMKMQNKSLWMTWAGYAFESVCFKHIAQIKNALGIGAVLTEQSQWSYKPKHLSEKGAQIDLIIDRDDDCINLCEIKFCRQPFTITRSYAEELRNKIDVFRMQTMTRKNIFLTFITPYGLKKNGYMVELVNSEILLEDLFT